MTLKSMLRTAKRAALESPRIFFAPLMGDDKTESNTPHESDALRLHPGMYFQKKGHKKKNEISKSVLNRLTKAERVELIQALNALQHPEDGYVLKYKKATGVTVVYTVSKRKPY